MKQLCSNAALLPPCGSTQYITIRIQRSSTQPVEPIPSYTGAEGSLRQQVTHTHTVQPPERHVVGKWERIDIIQVLYAVGRVTLLTTEPLCHPHFKLYTHSVVFKVGYRDPEGSLGGLRDGPQENEEGI